VCANLIHARVSAVQSIEHGLASYGRSTAQVVASARADLTKVVLEVQTARVASERRHNDAVRKREGAAAAAASCQENCGPLREALARAMVVEQEAQRDRDRHRQAEDQIQRLASELLSSLGTFEQSVLELVPRGRAFTADYARSLSDYLRRQVAG
jgi:hypothetical protein